MMRGLRAHSSRTVLMPTVMTAGRARSWMNWSTSCRRTGSKTSGGTWSWLACMHPHRISHWSVKRARWVQGLADLTHAPSQSRQEAPYILTATVCGKSLTSTPNSSISDRKL